MEKEFIVAIELGSSKITGIAGKKNLDGSISVLAVVQEPSAEFIRKGVIFNIDKTMVALKSIRERLERHLKTKIQQAYVGLGGKSMYGVINVIAKELEADTKITTDMTLQMSDENRETDYHDRKILDAITLEYKVDSRLQSDPVGIQCSHLKGNFLNIIWRQTYYTNIIDTFKEANIHIAEMLIAPQTLAESVLAEAERRAGCLLVDLGADTTTVSVYHRNLLRHIAVIPLGGANITRDIATLQMEEPEAEQMKLKYGNAYTDTTEIDPEVRYPIGNDEERTVECTRFIDLVEGRVEEIVRNAWNQVPREYQDKLREGIILTGGGANMRNIDRVFRTITHIEKVRIAKDINRAVDGTQPEVRAHDCRLNTALSLLAKGNTNCAGNSLDGGLFNSETGNNTPPEPLTEPQPGNDNNNPPLGNNDDNPPEPPSGGDKRPGWLTKVAKKAGEFIDGVFTSDDE